MVKTITPNTLTVQIPYGPVQSLPNLVPTSPHPSAPPSTPGGDLPPGGDHSSSSHHHAPRLGSPVPPRGISYPPLSPKSSLRRSVALQQSYSITSASTVGSKTPTGSFKAAPRNGMHPHPDGITIPVITGTPAEEDDDFIGDEAEKEAIEDANVVKDGGDPDKPSPARKGRIERGADTRRYHTAGAIEDIKVSFGIFLSLRFYVKSF